MGAAARAGLAYFAAVFAAGFVLGTLRVMVVVPALGEVAAVLLELPVMLALSWVACRWLIARFRVAARPAERLAMGGVAFAVLMLAEAGLAILGFGQSLAGYLSALTGLPGAIGLAGQVAFAAMPLVQARA